MNEADIERAIREKHLTSARVTPQAVDDQIVSAKYHNFPNTTVTVCCLILKNGFTVVGESACASPENFDEELGKQIARDNARQQIFKLEGYVLRNRIHNGEITEGVAA